MRYEYITKIEIKFDKKKTFKRKSIKYLQNFLFQESVKLPMLDSNFKIKALAEYDSIGLLPSTPWIHSFLIGYSVSWFW